MDNDEMAATPSVNLEPVVIVDAANVVGSRPDGWWRDRRAANIRLRDELGEVALLGFDSEPPPCEVVMVVEGHARGIDSTSTVAVVSAPASGDDTIVEIVATQPHRKRIVVTSDRELIGRVHALGAKTVGPRTVY
ncbi:MULTISPECIES: NTP pyrophosphohydrolase [Actinomycetes]|uniref:NTP pyrophosphohydrolase n=1 Tax=Actinomycetes TaxID=1760 RepID=UPI000B1A3C45|nr:MULTISPECIES: NTP pyrophosphohydrolase [Actinomycetes]